MAEKKLVSEVLGKIIIDTTQPDKALPGINALIQKLTSDLKEATKEAARLGGALGDAPKDSQEFAKLQQEIKGVKTRLSELRTIRTALKIADPKDIDGLKELNRQINLTVSTIEGMERRTAVRKGAFGLDPKTLREGETSLKALAKAAKEAKVELALAGDDKALKSLDRTIKQNESKLKQQIDNLRMQKMQEDQDHFANLELGKRQKALDRAHTQALAQNAEFDKKVAKQKQKLQSDQDFFENLELGKKQKALERAHLQALAMNSTFDKKLLAEKAKQFAAQELFENLSLGKRQKALEAAHTQAIAMEVTRNKRIAAERQKLEMEELHRQNQLLNPNKKGPVAEDELIKNAAQRRLGLIGGQGGASLIAVQASLMANYSILQNLTNTITAGVRNSVELESAFRNIQAVTVTTSKEMVGLETRIKDVAAASKFSSVEVAQAALILGQAGLNAKQTGDALKAVATLAVASGTSMAESVDLVTSVLGVFDKKASEAIDITNKITAAANSSKINVEKMALAFQYVGNTAAQMGVSFEESTAALAAMSNAGIKSGSTMGTGLRAFLTETQQPTEEFIKIITNLGLSLADLDFKAHGLLGVARKLREAGFIASDAIKSFDIRSAAAFNAMVANPEDLERQYKLLLDTNAGLAAEAVQMDSLKSQAARLTTSLSNLVATGFEPLGKLLKSVASGTATIAEAMSEWSLVMGVVGTTVSVLLVGAVAKYTLSLALGAAATLGLTSATAASVASMSVGAFTTAILTKAKLAYAAATATATASTFTLAGAVKALSGVTIFGALGLAIAAVTAVFVGFNHVMESSKRKTEELRAALDNSKGGYEEQIGVIQSLNNKIEELNHKADTLAGTQKDVELMAVALTAQFGKEGFASDKLSDSFAKQAKQLEKLRDLKEESAKQSLQLARLDAAALTQNQEQELSKEFSKVRQRGTVSEGINRALGSEDIKMLNVAQVNILRDMKKALEANDPNNPGPLASATEILRILALKVKDDKTLGLFSGRSNFFNEAADQLGVVSVAAGNVRQSREEQTTLDFKASQAEAARAFGKAKIFGDMTFTDALRDARSAGIEQRIIASGEARGDNGKTDPIRLHALAMQETRKSMDKLAELERVLEERRINTTDEAELSSLRTARTEVNARQEAAKVAMDRLTEQTQPIADRMEKARKAAAMGSERQKNKDVSAEEIRKNTLAGALHKHRGVINPVIQQELIDAELKGGEQRATNVRNMGPTSRLRQLRLSEEVATREAMIAQRDANLSGSEEAAMMFMEAGMKARSKARAAALEQLKVKLKEDSAVGGSREGLTKEERDFELRNFNEAEDQKDREFVQKFTGFANVAQMKLQQIRAQTNETRQDLLDLQNKNNQDNFARGERARELQERFDVNTGLGDPRGENIMLVRELKRELVNVDKQFLVSKSAELKLEDEIIEGEEKQLAVMESSLQTLEERLEVLQKIHDLGMGMTFDQQQEFIAAKGRLDPERTEVRNQRALVAGARRQRVDSQKELQTIRGRVRENQIPEIQEVNVENLGRAMDDVWAKWQNITANMDIVRTMREGFGDQINGFTTNLGNMFKTISVGTKGVTASFKDMALNTIDSIASIINQMLAMWAVQQMIGLVQTAVGAFSAGAGSVSGASVGTAPGSIFGGSSFNPSAISMPMPFGADGGFMTPSGFFERVQFMAGGGPVRGGVTGRDSVPTMLMPGEFVIKKNAVDVVGTDFLHGLNAQANGIAQKSAPRPPSAQSENKVLNVWVVSPEEAKQQTTTPNDIVVTIADNIERGGVVKKMIKQINLGLL